MGHDEDMKQALVSTALAKMREHGDGSHLEDLERDELGALRDAVDSVIQRRDSQPKEYEVSASGNTLQLWNVFSRRRIVEVEMAPTDDECSMLEIIVRRVDDTVPVGISLP